MSLIRLTIDRISYSQNTNGAYALLLNEKGGKRKLPIVIGGFEAQSIAVALEKEIKEAIKDMNDVGLHKDGDYILQDGEEIDVKKDE